MKKKFISKHLTYVFVSFKKIKTQNKCLYKRICDAQVNMYDEELYQMSKNSITFTEENESSCFILRESWVFSL